MARINMSHYEITVFGGGPAGIASALFCHQHGFKTILIHNGVSKRKGNLQIENVESIHPGIQVLLSSLKIEDDLTSLQLGSYTYINNGINKKSLNPYTNEVWQGLHISKPRFIDFLISKAKIQGLEVLDDSVDRVIVENSRIIGVRSESGIELYSKYTIDASGSKRVIGKQMRFVERTYSPVLVAWSGISVSAACDFNEYQNAYFIPDKYGWSWIAQLEDKSYYWTRVSKKDKADLLAPKQLSDSGVTRVSNVANMRWRIFRPLCMEGAILCGDAAGLIDPAAGQGILNALCSGIKAGQTAIACVQSKAYENPLLAEYDSWYFNQFQHKVTHLKANYALDGINLID